MKAHIEDLFSASLRQMTDDIEWDAVMEMFVD